jgi:hypothetical protein
MTGWSGLTDTAIDSRVHRRVKTGDGAQRLARAAAQEPRGSCPRGFFYWKKVVRTDTEAKTRFVLKAILRIRWIEARSSPWFHGKRFVKTSGTALG